MIEVKEIADGFRFEWHRRGDVLWVEFTAVQTLDKWWHRTTDYKGTDSLHSCPSEDAAREQTADSVKFAREQLEKQERMSELAGELIGLAFSGK